MANKIFYFTGSGNSLAIARTIAEGLGNTEVLPIAKHANGFVGTDEERIGIITPVLGWGPPRMVEAFADRLKTREGQYVFAVSDCGGTPAGTLKQLHKRLRRAGSNLDAGFTVRADFAAPLPGMEVGIIKFVAWLARNHIPGRFADRADEIVHAVADKALQEPEANNASANIVGTLMHKGAAGSFKTSDKDFAAGDACVSCGTCTTICPRENVRLIDDKPTWHGNCELCYGCYLWCPQKAISYRGASPTDPTHHPDVTVADMLLR